MRIGWPGKSTTFDGKRKILAVPGCRRPNAPNAVLGHKITRNYEAMPSLYSLTVGIVAAAAIPRVRQTAFTLSMDSLQKLPAGRAPFGSFVARHCGDPR